MIVVILYLSFILMAIIGMVFSIDNKYYYILYLLLFFIAMVSNNRTSNYDKYFCGVCCKEH